MDTADDRGVLELFNPSGSDIPYSATELRAALRTVEHGEQVRFALLEVVFLPPDEMVDLNRQHKNHDYLTDILTFPYHEVEDTELEATLYCSADRIREQAGEWKVPAKQEFRRVFIHGLLHLCGYDDQSENDRSAIREREDHYLNLWPVEFSS